MAGRAAVMGNAPEEVRRSFDHVTEDNNHEGIYLALRELGLVKDLHSVARSSIGQ